MNVEDISNHLSEIILEFDNRDNKNEKQQWTGRNNWSMIGRVSMNHIDANKGIQERGRGLNNRNPDKWKEREWWNQIILGENV